MSWLLLLTAFVSVDEGAVNRTALQDGQGDLLLRHEAPLRDRVAVAVRTVHAALYVGDARSLRIAVHNVVDEPVRGLFLVDPALGKVRLQYRYNDSHVTPLEYLHTVKHYVDPPRVLQPGGSVAVTTVLAFDTVHDRFVLHGPG